MSYDIEIMIPAHEKKCPHCHEPLESVEEECLHSWDPTYNYGPMFRAALGSEEGIYAWDGKPVSDVLPLLRAMLVTLEGDPHRFRKYDAPNGWGTYDSLVPFLRQTVLPAFESSPPEAVVRVS